MVAPKPATLVAADTPVDLTGPADRFVGRGGEKLARALDVFGIDVTGRSAVDLGASTGGFTDCLLQHGAVRVTAVDVGHNQLDYRLRNDPRVRVYERTNVRTMDTSMLDGPFAVVVADLSFISLELVMPAVAALCAEDGDVVLLIKPQFEVGKDQVSRGGLVSDPVLWRQAIDRIVGAAAANGLGAVGIIASPLLGASAGNREFLVWLQPGQTEVPAGAIERALAAEGIES